MCARDRSLLPWREIARGKSKEAVESSCVLATHFFDFFTVEKIDTASFRSLDLLTPDAVVNPPSDGAFQFGSLRKIN
jgi:hypothetical protein